MLAELLPRKADEAAMEDADPEHVDREDELADSETDIETGKDLGEKS
jgi:hypothetical protein